MTYSDVYEKIAERDKRIKDLETRLDGHSCRTCLYMTEPETGEHCGKCTHNYVDWYKPMTNGQKLRMMDNHALAQLLSADYGICGLACDREPECNNGWKCAEKIESWLNAPVENQGQENDGTF